MEESDELAARAIDGFLVDELDARSRSRLKLGNDVVRAERKVMHATGGVLFEELRNGAVRAGGLQKFDMNIANAKEGGADFLRDDFFAMFAFEAERFFVIRDSLLERLDSDTQVVDFLDHKFTGDWIGSIWP